MTIIDLSFMLAPVEDKHAWRDQALCSQVDPELFFPEKGVNAKPAKRICGMCDVRDECLQWALDNNEQFGIFGGLSERERRPLVQARREERVPLVKVCKGCGEEFQPYRTRLVYCSMACRRQSEKESRKRHSRECRSCGRHFIGVSDHCSPACLKKSHRSILDKRDALKIFTVVCRVCCEDFETSRVHTKYCSDSCRQAAILAQRRQRTRSRREAS
ncbi:hypothetical protein PBI_VELVETEEN_55 [Mycobacterium phage Velveteen]|uniref:WhiB n=1 Tax=Mycobacterium phage Cerasum TaxID=1527463 RepID=UPI000387FEDE|nr:hypothetical protein N858_gp055 [Mycobacterium phage Velveteen]YP_009125909.1 WhiB [Mycobacterium phage Cerasum]ARM70649.1 WhiB family transcription factor [Mycobacterium phage Kingsley]AVR76448.1 WhiB family transcription factor [Mycobacterium phage BigPhil]QOP65497.1 WhiB family transcription factor [Mycobacterium phage Coco12]QZD98537.1 WhiB family transcription factor [Mycobacterium phage Sarma624]AGT12262.1 hypothetical protein PBI_VELVETEEN_55 [Mycobacterium phage Velveteen]